MDQVFFHHPVLAEEAVEFLITDPNGIYLDCTTGGAGHSEKILKRISKKGILVCLDADSESLRYAVKRLASFPNKVLKNVFFDQLDIVLVQENLLPARGVLFDLGLSSYQIDHKEKGFSFLENGPLDMRFNKAQKLSAAEVVNNYSLDKLGKIFREYGEEKNWRRIAQEIILVRAQRYIKSTGELSGAILSVIPERFRNKTLARIFQAIRIEVNQELERLKRALPKAFEILGKNGRIVVISYHSLEDRIVKEFFRYKELDCVCPPEFPRCVCDKEKEMEVLTRKPVRPTNAEIIGNPRARSAKLRVAKKIVPYRSLS